MLKQIEWLLPGKKKSTLVEVRIAQKLIFHFLVIIHVITDLNIAYKTINRFCSYAIKKQKFGILFKMILLLFPKVS